MTREPPECYTCLHYLKVEVPPGTRMNPRCRAYPDGIPKEIFFLNVPHRDLRGDEEEKLVFTPRGDAPKEASGPQAEGRRFRRLPVL